MIPGSPIEGQMSFDDLLGPVGDDTACAVVTGPVDATAGDRPGESEVNGLPGPPPLAVQVTRSGRRRKTAEARLIGDVLDVRIPGRCTKAEEEDFVAHFRAKFERSRSAEGIDLDRRAAELAAEHGLPTPSSIRWVDNQRQRWGSCTPSEATVRLSSRLAGFPPWVIDYVIVHELAHLLVGDHSGAFWSLVERYPLSERARGYLMAKSTEPD